MVIALVCSVTREGDGQKEEDTEDLESDREVCNDAEKLKKVWRLKCCLNPQICDRNAHKTSLTAIFRFKGFGEDVSQARCPDSFLSNLIFIKSLCIGQL